MDNIKIGNLIYKLRKENNMTQLELAQKMNISDKTVSKWERGLGCPELSLLADLSEIFCVDLEKFLSGELCANATNNGDIRNMKFYICPKCGNLITSMSDISLSCCGKKIKSTVPKEAEKEQKLSIELSENAYYVTSPHEMTKEHYITFVALLTNDSIMIVKQYPEWELHAYIPAIAHGKLTWHCNKHGLFYQNI